MRRKRLSQEVRFRASEQDLERLEYLLENHPEEYRTVSVLLRALISREHAALLSLRSGLPRAFKPAKPIKH